MLRNSHLLIIGTVSATAILQSTASQDGPGTLILTPQRIVEDDTGGVWFTVLGSSLPPLMACVLRSPDLDAACTGGHPLIGQLLSPGDDGDTNPNTAGSRRVAGTHRATAPEASAPYQSMSGCLNVETPEPRRRRRLPPPQPSQSTAFQPVHGHLSGLLSLI